MAEAVPPLGDPLEAHLAALANAASILDWPLPRERDEATCHELARVVDALLVRVCARARRSRRRRGRGARPPRGRRPYKKCHLDEDERQHREELKWPTERFSWPADLSWPRELLGPC